MVIRPADNAPYTNREASRLCAGAICFGSGVGASPPHVGSILDDAALASLQQQLHPHEPVVGTPRLVFGGSDGP